MQLPIDLLHRFMPTRMSSKEIARLLTERGIEADDTHETIEDVVAAKILSIRPHPNADRLQLVTIDQGDIAPVEVVCGAQNIAVGQIVPFARVGANLPGGKLEARTIRGVQSAGMLLSGAELGINTDGAGIHLLEEQVKPGTAVAINTSIEIATKSPRYDILSGFGIARELFGPKTINPPSALTQIATLPSIAGHTIKRGPATAYHALEIQWDNPRLSAEQKKEFQAAGIHSEHPMVDILNYVLLATGHPMHAFDLQKLGADLKVEQIGRPQPFEGLDGSSYSLKRGDLVVRSGKKAVALAGIIGEQETAVSAETTHFIIEAACFPAPQIAATSTRLGLLTASSLRFRRGSDQHTLALSLGYCAALLKQSGARLVGYSKDEARTTQSTLTFDPDAINALLGTRYTKNAQEAALRLVGCTFPAAGKRVQMPAWRSDLNFTADLAEEVARVRGYAEIPSTALTTTTTGQNNGHWQRQERIRTLGVALGFTEVSTSSFASVGAVKIENSPTKKQYLRASLYESHLEVLRRALRTLPEAMIFEIGTIHLKTAEHIVVTFTCSHDQIDLLQRIMTMLSIPPDKPNSSVSKYFEPNHSFAWKSPSGFMELGFLSHGNALVAHRKTNTCALTIDTAMVADDFGYHRTVDEPPVYPTSIFDLSFYLNGILFSKVWSAVNGNLPAGVQKVRFLDYFYKNSRLSVTLRFEIGFADHTPNQAELQNVQKLIREHVSATEGVMLRDD